MTDAAWSTVRAWLQNRPLGARLAPSSCGVVVGASGIGKTTRVLGMCAELGYEVIHIGSEHCANAKEFRDRFVKSCRCRLEASIRGSLAASRVLVLDDFESLIQMDRMIPSTLWGLLHGGTLPDLCVLCILCTPFDRKLGDVRTRCTLWHIPSPGVDEIVAILRAQFPNGPHIHDTAVQAGGNLSYAIQRLRAWGEGRRNTADRMAPPPPPQTLDVADLYDCDDAGKVCAILAEDPWVTPLRFHENLLGEMHQRGGTEEGKRVVYLALLEQLCAWDAWISVRPEETDPCLELLARCICVSFAQLPRPMAATDAAMSEFTKVFSLLSLRKKNARVHAQDPFVHVHLPSLAWTVKNYEV